ncbi:hypothetical protein B9Z55_023508 [Caenorhabditis nigoni]|uniref:DUF38 domain-containing protein n=1 Tax=Caenorhabditis nigoni TaxID=1611254 RepID=A0A2G5SPZ9_9PELO|nr:hypothetical protein B9Z55_023508 [Caenorhabditis nigoni]
MKERILLHEDAELSEQDVREQVTKLSAADLVEHIRSPDEDPKECLVRHMIQTFIFKKKTLICNRKMDKLNDEYLLNIMGTFDKVYVSNFMKEWTVTPKDIRLFCERVKDIDFTLNFKEGEKNFKFDKAFESEELNATYYDYCWLDIDNLLAREHKMKCLELQNVTEQDVNSILTQ